MRGLLPARSAPPPPRKVNVMRVARVDPLTRTAVIIPIQTNMRTIRRVVGAEHVGVQLVTTLENVQIHVCCCNSVAEGPIWRVRGSLPIRGRGILYANIGAGPADFPSTNDWLKRMIEFEPEGVTRAINDPRQGIGAWSATEKDACRERCAQAGDPPCWEVAPDDKPCIECKDSDARAKA